MSTISSVTVKGGRGKGDMKEQTHESCDLLHCWFFTEVTKFNKDVHKYLQTLSE